MGSLDQTARFTSSERSDMPAQRDDIRVKQGATYRRVYQLLDTDLTGAAARSQWKASDGTLLADLSYPPVDGSGITMELQYTDDGRPVTFLTVVAQDELTALLTAGIGAHDIKVTEQGGEADYLAEGTVTIVAQVTT